MTMFSYAFYVERCRYLEDIIKKHHAQHGNDKCFENDNELYAAIGLPPHNPCDLSCMTEAEHESACTRYRRGLPLKRD